MNLFWMNDESHLELAPLTRGVQNIGHDQTA